jgi:hypothetical protein
MTGVIVVVLVAVVVTLLAGVGVSVLRLRTALHGLRAVADSSAAKVGAVVDELKEAGRVTSLESAQLQADIAQLRAGRRDD